MIHLFVYKIALPNSIGWPTATHLVISSGSQDLARPRPDCDAVGLVAVCYELVRLEASEQAEGFRARLKHDGLGSQTADR